MENKTEKKFLWLFILSIIFGIAGGIFGEIISRVYIFENAFNIPYFGEINYDRNTDGFSNLIIRDAKNVVVEQDQKVIETAASVGSAMVGIYKKDAFKDLGVITGDNTTKVNLANFNSISGEGVIITSDGWIMTSFSPIETAKTADKTDNVNSQAKWLEDYLVVTKDKKIYKADKIIIDKFNQLNFWHIKALDLPVARFLFNSPDLKGQQFIAVNWRGWVGLNFILGQTSNVGGGTGISTSDKFSKQLFASQAFKKEFTGSFLYNLGGEITGLVLADKLESIDNFNPAINSILKFKLIKRPALGVNYINLSDLIVMSGTSLGPGALIAKDASGVAIVKGSAAEKAGLKEGDIILEVNNLEINSDNSLNAIINRYLPGDEISLTIERDKTMNEIKVKLGELK